MAGFFRFKYTIIGLVLLLGVVLLPLTLLTRTRQAATASARSNANPNDPSEIATYLAANDQIEQTVTKLANDGDAPEDQQPDVQDACQKLHYKPFENLNMAGRKKVVGEIISKLEGGPSSQKDLLSDQSLLHLAVQQHFSDIPRQRRIALIGRWLQSNDPSDLRGERPQDSKILVAQVDIGLQDMLSERGFSTGN